MKQSSWDYERERRRRNKAKAVEYMGGRCEHCKGVFPNAVYDFHHTNPKEKEYKPTRLMRLSWETITKELEKCELLCANCHRIHHHKEL